MKSKLFSLLVFLITLLIIAFSGGKKKRLNTITENDHYNYIAINECLMWVSNNGDGSHNPLTDGSGFYWPRELRTDEWGTRRLTAIFEDGLIFGGIYQGQIRVNGNTHRQGLQAGKILPDGIPDDPSKEKYRVYKIRKYWEDLAPGPHLKI